MEWHQQGDVMMKPVSALPSGGRALPQPVLADGEATGHQHVASGEGVAVLEVAGQRYLDAPDGAEVIHPEHHRISVPPGVYRIEQVREFDHFAERARRVMD